MIISQLRQATEWRSKAAHGKTVGFVVKTDQAPKRGGRNIRQSIVCRPVRGLNLLGAIQPTVPPWATFCRASGALVAMILFFAFCAMATATNDLSDTEIQGRQLARKIFELLEQQPTENFTNTGHLTIRRKDGARDAFRFQFRAVVTATNWQAIYETTSESYRVKFLIVHDVGGNRFFEVRNDENIKCEPTFPFAGSDFWAEDLGLEFFHWPEQKILKHEMRRGRACKVLESTNPAPSTNNYSRVVSWIDNESGGIVQAEGYDFKNKLLKEFAPKSFKKVNGQWELQEMEIRNVQTGSRTRLEFDLEKE